VAGPGFAGQAGADIVLLAIEHDVRLEIQRLLKSNDGHRADA